MLTQRREMLRGTITHVGFPAKAGKIARLCNHEAVAMLLRDDARRRNARVERIAADDRARAVPPFGKAVAIDENLVRVKPQSLDRARHRQQGRLQDVDAVDLRDARLADAPAAARLDLDFEFTAAFRGQFLAVVEPRDTALAEQHRRRDDRPRERPAASLVDADDHVRRSRTDP